jgi:mycothiol synthase
MEIRACGPEDAPELAALCARELTLERGAAAFPERLMRRPHLCLVATEESRIRGACFGSWSARRHENGFIDLVVVDRREQRRGVGRRLMVEMERALARRGCLRVGLKGNPPHYLWPGIDTRYRGAIGLAEALGYVRGEQTTAMEIDLLRGTHDTAAEEHRLSELGIEVRRAHARDARLLRRSLSRSWGSFLPEILAALELEHAGVHIAVRKRRCIAYSAYGVKGGDDLGPMGTESQERGAGIGRVLFVRCLADQRRNGYTTAEGMWVGAIGYFEGLSAVVSRRFWTYERTLPD